MKLFFVVGAVASLLLVGAAVCFPASDAEDPDVYDVLLLGGQSNMADTFRAVASEAKPICKPGQAYYYGNSEGQVLITDYDYSQNYGIYDISINSNTSRIGGIEQSLAYEYLKSTTHKILIINCGASGTTVTQWYPTKVCYTYAQDCFSKAIAHVTNMGGSIGEIHFIWCQGESDKTLSISTYIQRFTTIIDSMTDESDTYSFNEDYTIEDVWFILPRQKWLNSVMAQINMAATDERMNLGFIGCDHFTTANGLLESDDTHYTQFGRNIIGAAVGKALAQT